MIVEKNVSIAGMTTFKLGGRVKEMFFPENAQDISILLKESPDALRRIVSNGSNILANDAQVWESAVCMKKFTSDVICLEGKRGLFHVGAGCRIQKLIRTVGDQGYGGMEPLVSIPGLLGGLIYMNASVPSSSCSISDHLVSVDIVDVDGMKVVPKSECDFTHRQSIFQKTACVITGATFLFPESDKGESALKINDRIERCRMMQDRSRPNFGSVFSESNSKIMRCVRMAGMRVGGISFSRKTQNWLINEGGTFSDAMRLIKRVETIHALFGLPCKREVVIWE